MTKKEKQFVLKVALNEDDNARLHEEAEALRSFHSEFIVAIEDELVMHGRTVLVLQKAGDKTLAAQLRTEGVPSLEMLARYGDDLLSAVAHLERQGVVHRDIKPDNIGIRSLTKQRNQLILFDFSLARAPLDNIRVGTSGYTDPFLVNRKPQRWDLAAERYSVGVTLYEMTLGEGVLPQWGDGKSDPALTDDELVLDAEKFDPSVREGLVEFFLTSLHRDPPGGTTTPKRCCVRGGRSSMSRNNGRSRPPAAKRSISPSRWSRPISRRRLPLWASAPVPATPWSEPKFITVRNLLEFPIRSIHVMRGVGNQTRQEIIRFINELRERFPNTEAAVRRNPRRTDSGSAAPADPWLRATPRRNPIGTFAAGCWA